MNVNVLTWRVSSTPEGRSRVVADCWCPHPHGASQVCRGRWAGCCCTSPLPPPHSGSLTVAQSRAGQRARVLTKPVSLDEPNSLRRGEKEMEALSLVQTRISRLCVHLQRPGNPLELAWTLGYLLSGRVETRPLSSHPSAGLHMRTCVEHLTETTCSAPAQ